MKKRAIAIISAVGLLSVLYPIGASAYTGGVWDTSTSGLSAADESVEAWQLAEAPSDDDGDAEVVWDWAHEASARSVRVIDYIYETGLDAMYSSSEIDHDTRRFFFRFVTLPSEVQQKEMQEIAGDIPVDFLTGSALAFEDYIARAESLYEKVGRGANGKVGSISPSDALDTIYVGVWFAEDQEETAATVKEIFAPASVRITFVEKEEVLEQHEERNLVVVP